MNGPNTDAENTRAEVEYAAFVVTETRDTYDFLVRVVLIGGGTILALLIAGGFLLWMVNNS